MDPLLGELGPPKAAPVSGGTPCLGEPRVVVSRRDFRTTLSLHGYATRIAMSRKKFPVRFLGSGGRSGRDSVRASAPTFVVGVVLFASGFVINQHSDWILFHLRRPGETGYKIPHGGLYRLVSCPNYFGELIEWSGWALATWSLPGLAFAVWTAANLIPRAWAHHKWYRKQFADYPPGRKAIIPLVF